MNKPIGTVVRSALALMVFVAATVSLLTMPARSARAEPSHCPGQTEPTCDFEETCVAIPKGTECTTDYFYFPDPS